MVIHVLQLHQKVMFKNHGYNQLKKGGQAYGPISIAQLNVLLRLHMQPIKHVIFVGSHRDTLS